MNCQTHAGDIDAAGLRTQRVNAPELDGLDVDVGNATPADDLNVVSRCAADTHVAACHCPRFYAGDRGRANTVSRTDAHIVDLHSAGLRAGSRKAIGVCSAGGGGQKAIAEFSPRIAQNQSRDRHAIAFLRGCAQFAHPAEILAGSRHIAGKLH